MTLHCPDCTGCCFEKCRTCRHVRLCTCGNKPRKHYPHDLARGDTVRYTAPDWTDHTFVTPKQQSLEGAEFEVICRDGPVGFPNPTSPHTCYYVRVTSSKEPLDEEVFVLYRQELQPLHPLLLLARAADA